MSADGRIVIGTAPGSAFSIWQNGSTTTASIPGEFSQVNDVSNNGIVVGYQHRQNQLYTVGFKWQDGVYTTLKWPPGTDNYSADYITPDGNVILGRRELPLDEGGGGGTRVVLWKDDDVFEIGCPPGIDTCFPRAISADGEVLLVSTSIGGHLWKNGDWIKPELPPGGYDLLSEARLSSNGKVIAGILSRRITDDGGYWESVTGLRLEWESGAYTLFSFGETSESDRTSIYHINADGSVVVGGGAVASNSAHVWREGHGVANLRNLLAQSGVSTEGWYIGPARFVSDDGRIVVGRGIAPGVPGVTGWMAVLGPGTNEPIQVNSIADRPQTSGQLNCNTGQFVELDGEDAPECTLRAAIETLNERAQADSISFNIDGGGSHIIELGSALPMPEYPIILDATTQPGYNGFPMISIHGLENIENGLVLTEGESVVRGFSIGGFTQAGIHITSGSDNIIEANHIGINAAGTSAFPNRSGLIIEESSDNQIGGPDPAQMNVISGNTDTRTDIKMSEELTGIGIMIRGSGSSGNVIQGNRIGTDYAGQQAVGNGYTGVYLYKAPSNEIGGDEEEMGNLISGNGTANVQIFGSDAVENIVSGNLIGTNADGTSSLNAEGSGITIAYGSWNRIGGNTDTPGSAPGNIISGHGSAGVVLVGITPEAVEPGNGDEAGIASDNIIAGNLIGTAKNGTSGLANQIGILAGYDAHKTQIGGGSGFRNIISGNESAGIILADSTGGFAPHETVIAGNYIGTDITGDEALGNGGPGIQFATLGLTMTETTGIAGVTIGGMGEQTGNVIAGNSDQQIEIFGPMSAGTQILNNSIGILANGQPGQNPEDSEFGILVKSSEILIGADIEGNAAGNTIGGNKYGVLLAGNLNVAVNNRVGTNTPGTSAMPNEVGIWVLGNGNHILGNTISGNTRFGVMVGQESGDTGGFEGQFFEPEMTMLVNNMIGTNTQGTGSVGNGLEENGAGVVFWRGKNLHMYLNTISGNYHGVRIDNSQFEEGTRMGGNLIGAGGVNPAEIAGMEALPEFTPVPNHGDGVHVTNGRVYLTRDVMYDELSHISLGNYIQNNLGAGIRRTGSNLSTDFEITSNYFFGNVGLAIDFEPEGAGVSGDMHRPPLLLPPVFSRENRARIRGTSSVNGNVQFYSTPICHASGFGEGRLYLSGKDRSVSAGQEFTLDIENPDNMQIGFYITTLVTSANRTSEFSQCVRIADEDLYQEGLLDDLAGSALELLELTLTLDDSQPKSISSHSNPKRDTGGRAYAAKYTLPADNNRFEGSATAGNGTLIEPDTLDVNQYWSLFSDTEDEIPLQICINISNLDLDTEPSELVVLYREHPGEPWVPYPTSLGKNGTQLCASGLSGFGEIALGTQSDQTLQIFTEVTLSDTEGWRMLSLPDQSQTLGDFFGDFANHAAFNLFTFDQTAYDWDDESVSLNTIPGPGNAFIVYAFEEDLPRTLKAAGDWILPNGTFQYSDLGYDENSTDNHYLLGNPHPFVLDYCKMTGTSQHLNHSIWFWDPATGYADFNCSVDDEVFIAPYQAFWVYTAGASPQLGVPEEAYSNRPPEGYFKEGNQQDEERLLLTLRVENMQTDLVSSARILFSPDASETMGVMDTPHLSSSGLLQNWISFYSVGEDQNRYSLQALPETYLQNAGSIALAAESNQAGAYSIKWELPPTYRYDGKFYLKDHETGAVTDLSQSTSYQFEISEEQASKKSRGTTEAGGAGVQTSVTGPPHSAMEPSQLQPRFELIVSQDESRIPGEEPGILPESYALSQNYPNPFNPATIISYELPQAGQVRLDVYDMTGRQITTLVNREMSAGHHQITFDASHLSSGIYMYRLHAGGQMITRRLTVLK